MRFFAPTALRTATFTAFLVTAPFSGAYAASSAVYSPRVAGLIDQVQSLDDGIAAARQVNKITPAEAHSLQMRAAHISRVAQRTAAAGHGTMPVRQYQQLLHQVDDLSQKLRTSTGSNSLIGDGADGGYYPNG
ncbi:hypothetical protein NKI56_04115 [Mesorhizobium sp. M0622]|uniref:hypothetical protein n=1 Tax=unclassified Mesorhizobium TaxID=325217 RepID=UPI003335BE3E